MNGEDSRGVGGKEMMKEETTSQQLNFFALVINVRLSYILNNGAPFQNSTAQ